MSIDPISDDEFDSLLATIPLPGLPSPTHPPTAGTQNSKRKIQHTTPEQDHVPSPTDQIYEPIKFGEISKYMSNKRKKLKLQESALRDLLPSGSTPPQTFTGTVIHVNGYTNPPLSELRNMIILHGGTYMAYLDHKSAITHIIASTLTPKKRQEFRNYKVVKPEWVVKSISAGRLLNWSDFRLMGPRTLTEDTIAKGEATGGQVVAQKTLFNLTKAPLSTLSVHSSSQISSPNQTSQDQPSLLRKNPPSNLTSDTLPPTVHTNLESTSTRPSSKTSQKLGHSHPSVDKCIPALSSPLKLSKQTPHVDHPTSKNSLCNPQANSSSSANHEEMINMPAISCTDPDFIHKYFQQSRLHHLSTWKADLLQRVSILSEQKELGSKNHTVSKKKIKGDPSDRRVIMHVDFDCFFISAGLIARPELQGKPMAVCHAKASGSGKLSTSTSEIASCSYEARAFGVRNGQTLGKAQQLCPEIQTIPYDFELYENLSLKFYNILLSYADELQAVSVDECLIDVSSRFTNQFSPSGFDSMESNSLKLAEEIRTTIRIATQCEASIGISYNVLLAKLATKKAKPSGSFFLSANRVQHHLKELSIDQLPGFGWSQKNEIEQKLPLVRSVGDILTTPLSRLIEVLGPVRGKTLHQYAHGIDDRPLKSTNHERKSVSAVINYGIRFSTAVEGGNDQVHDFLRRLGLEVSRRLTELDVSGRQLTLKIMKRAPNAPIEPTKYMGHGICEEFSKSAKLVGPAGAGVSDGMLIGLEAWKLLQSMLIQPEDLRGIGIQINRLERRVNVDKHKTKVQSTLSFQTTKAIEPPTRRPGPRQETQDVHANKLGIAGSGLRTPIASTSKRTSITTPKIPNSTPLFIPPASQLDLNVVNQLPASLKTRILKSYSIAPEPIDKNDPVCIDLITPQRNSNSIKNYQGLPSASQVDWKLLAELPSSVRKPIEAIYKDQQRHPRCLPPPTPPNFTRGLKRVTRSTRVDSSSGNVQDAFPPLNINVSKKQKIVKKSNLSRRVGPSQKLIYGKTFKLVTQKKKEPKSQPPTEEQNELLPTPNKISDEQLEALKIDPRFFRELGNNGHSSVTRAFQLDLIWNQYQMNSSKLKEVTNKTDRWKKWRKNFDRGPNQKILEIKLPEPPTIGSKEDGEGMNKLQDVIELIDRWVTSHALDTLNLEIHDQNTDVEEESFLAQIDPRDIDIIHQFLLDSVPLDLEKVSQIILWWEFSVHHLFRSPQLVPLLQLPWKNYWQDIIEKVKSKINSLTLRLFDAPIY